MTVLNELKPELDEKLHERALTLELQRRGHDVEPQRRFPVHYRGELIGDLVPDLLVDRAVLVDAKVVSCFNDAHLAQMIGYLTISGLELGVVAQLQISATRMEASDATAEPQ